MDAGFTDFGALLGRIAGAGVPAADFDGGPAAQENITVTTTDKGVEFVFPAFGGSMYYDPIVASADSFEACSICERTSSPLYRTVLQGRQGD